jgi:hypothetical protein
MLRILLDQHRLYGIIDGKYCRDCNHCINGQDYYKRATKDLHCTKFRDKASVKTKVKGTMIACGKFERREQA